jgi:hypothetical protein
MQRCIALVVALVVALVMVSARADWRRIGPEDRRGVVKILENAVKLSMSPFNTSTYVGISTNKNWIHPGITRTEQPRGGHSRIPVPGDFFCRDQPLHFTPEAVKKLKKWHMHDRLLILQEVLAQWQQPVSSTALLKPWNWNWAMYMVLYRHIAMAIRKNGQQTACIFHH